jgi:hypothetical protein
MIHDPLPPGSICAQSLPTSQFPAGQSWPKADAAKTGWRVESFSVSRRRQARLKSSYLGHNRLVPPMLSASMVVSATAVAVFWTQLRFLGISMLLILWEMRSHPVPQSRSWQ